MIEGIWMSAASSVFESASCAASMRGEWKAPETLRIFACLAPIEGAILHSSSSTWLGLGLGLGLGDLAQLLEHLLSGSGPG